MDKIIIDGQFTSNEPNGRDTFLIGDIQVGQMVHLKTENNPNWLRRVQSINNKLIEFTKP